MIKASSEAPQLNETDAPENAGRKQGQFCKGQSGNPRGKLKGTRNRATILAAALLEGEAEGLMRKLIDLAMTGDPSALRLCVERLVAKPTERPIQFLLPSILAPTDAVTALSSVMEGLAIGALTASEARSLVGVIEATLKAFEVLDLDQRLAALEEHHAKS